jgi:hypothetical protein
MLKLFNDFGIALIENVFIPCFGTNWLAWVTLLTTLIFCIFCIVCIVLIVKNAKLKNKNEELTGSLKDANKTIATKSTQINQLTETLAATDGKLKVATASNTELNNQLMTTKETYEKEVAGLKAEVEKLKAVDSIVNETKEAETVVEEAKAETILAITEEVKKPKASTKKKKPTASKEAKAKKSEEETK